MGASLFIQDFYMTSNMIDSLKSEKLSPEQKQLLEIVSRFTPSQGREIVIAED